LWRCLTAPTFYMQSQEIGTVSLADPNYNTWQWETLIHGSIGLVGYVKGGSISYNNGALTPNFTPGTSNVQVAVVTPTFSVTYTPVLNCVPVFGSVIAPPTTISYTSHAGFNAKP